MSVARKKDFKDNVIAVLKNEGYQIGMTKFRPTYFENLNMEAKTVFDIGVCRGTPSLYQGFTKSKLVLVDPLVEAKSVAESNGFDFIHCACGSENTTAVFEVPKGKLALTSLLERTELTAPNVEMEKRETPVRTLDSIVAEYNYEPKFGMKIDTEGFELEVLKGASETLKNTEFVIAEVSILKRFEGSYDFSELIAYLAAHDLELLTILEHSNRFIDCLFAKKGSKLFLSSAV